MVYIKENIKEDEEDQFEETDDEDILDEDVDTYCSGARCY